MTSRLDVLYDVAAAQRRVTSLFGGGAGLHIAQPGKITHWRFDSRGATRDVTVTGGGGEGFTFHNFGAPFIIQLLCSCDYIIIVCINDVSLRFRHFVRV